MPSSVEEEMSKALVRSLGTSVTELSELIADKIRYLRWTSAVRTLEKARQVAEPFGGLKNVPPLKFFLPFMENCSLEEDDDDAIEMWAHLLVSAAQEFKPGHLLFMRILKEITGSEARLLRLIAHSTGRAVVSKAALEDAQFNWEMFSAPASPLHKIEIGKSWQATRDFVFENFQLPGIGIEHLSLSETKGDTGGYREIESLYKNDTIFAHEDQVSIDILISLNVIAWQEERFAQGPFELHGAAYFTTAMGAAFYAACADRSAVVTPRDPV